MLVAGEGGPRNIVNTSPFNLIVDGQILLLYKNVACPKERYNVELHELLHALGFAHSLDENNVMYNVTSCGQAISQNTIQELIDLYEVESLPDLYFKDVAAIKKGAYLDLNFTLSNRGLETSKSISISLDFGEDKEEIYNFTELAAGEGRFVWMQNLKVPLNAKKASLIVTNGKELDYNNNIVELSL